VKKGDLHRLARRSGVKRTSRPLYEQTRGCLKIFLVDLTRDALAYSDHQRRDESSITRYDPWGHWGCGGGPAPTLTAEDVVHALRRTGTTLYRCGV
ncbi:hypothetical protein B0H10DRAFT_1781849, partial [Mycena sp. CBHHK59/15]